MERLLILLILGLTVLGLTTFSAKANEMDFFEEFNEEFENKVDIEIESLDLILPESREGKAGVFKFKKFQIQNENVSIFLGNEESVFDSNIFVKGSRVGIKGPHTRFAYKLDEINTEYFHSFKWVNVKNTSLLMDSEKISLRGEYYEIRKPETRLNLQNFIWDCERNKDYLVNDSRGFLASCLNEASIYPSVKDGLIDIDFTFFGPNDNPKDQIDFKSTIKNIYLSEEGISGGSEMSTLTFGNGVHLAASHMTADCYKVKNLIQINTENMLNPCLNDFKMESELFGIYFKDTDQEFFNFEKPVLSLTEDSINLSNKMFIYESPETKIKLQNVSMSAAKFENFGEIDFDSYLRSLYNANSFGPTKGHEYSIMDFKMIDLEAKEDETKEVFIRSHIDSFKTNQNKITVSAPKSTISLDDNYDFHFNDLSIECDKESNIIKFSGTKVLADCKHKGTYIMRDILIDNKKDEKRPKYFLKPEYLKVKDGYLSLLAPGFQLVDEKENITLLNNSIKCRKDYESDLFDILDVIEGCFKESRAYISRIVSEKNKKRDATEYIYDLYERMLQGKVANPISLIRTRDAFVRDVKININNNWIKIDLDIKFLKADLKVKAEGRITLDRETEMVTIDIKQAKLPLTKSKKVLLYFLKKNMANDTISFKNGKIFIKL